MFLKAPQVRLEQAKCSFGIPRFDARSPQTDYAAFLLLYDAPRFGDELLGTAKIVFGTHLSNNNASGAPRLGVLSSGTQCRSSQSALSCSDALRRSSFTGIAVRTQCAQLTPANARRVRHIFAGCPDRIDKEPSRRIQRPAGGIRRPAHSFAFEAKTAKGGQGSAGTDCRRPRSRIKGNGGSARRGEPQRASYPSSPTQVA